MPSEREAVNARPHRKQSKGQRRRALLITSALLVVISGSLAYLPGQGVGEGYTLSHLLQKPVAYLTQKAQRAGAFYRQGYQSLRRQEWLQTTPQALEHPGPAITANTEESVYLAAADPNKEPDRHAEQMNEMESRQRFSDAVTAIQQGRSGDAINHLHRVLQLNPEMPEAYVNMGFALIQQQQYAAARDFFDSALMLNPSQANALYGMGAAYDGLGELEMAMGAMRSFLHLIKPLDPNHKFANRARSALWELEARMGDGPWGPDKGIPNGMQQAALLRDGQPVHGLRGKPGDTMPGLLRKYAQQQ
tara:strand:+ start:1639 stop:2553 length:915 start_codon:yes stop_codon:yes gene_type:complete